MEWTLLYMDIYGDIYICVHVYMEIYWTRLDSALLTRLYNRCICLFVNLNLNLIVDC